MTTKTVADPVQELKRLQAEALNLATQSQEVRAMLAANQQQTAEVLQQIAGGSPSSNGHVAPSTPPVAAVAVKPGPKPGPKAASKPASDKTGVRAQNDKSLKETIWDILDRPKNGEGLTAVEITTLITSENEWKSNGNISNMVYQAIHNLKKEGKLVRNDETKKFYIPEGVTFQ